MAVPPPLKVVTINVASIKSVRARSMAFFLFSQLDAEILFLQETRLTSLADIHMAKREWRYGPSYWSLAAEPYGGVAVLFKTGMVTVRRVIEVEIGRCMVLDVLVGGQDLRLINVYGPHTKWDRKCLFTRIKPFLFTSRQVVFGGDFNTVTRPKDRKDFKDRLGYDSVFLNSMVRDAGLVDVHIKHLPDDTGFTFHRGNSQSRIDRFFLKETSAFSPPVVQAVEFSDHCMLSVVLNASDAPQRGKGIWRLNSTLLKEEHVRQSFEEFFQAQVTILDFCSSKAEWWELTKKRIAGFFRGLANRKQFNKYMTYQRLRRKLDILVSRGGDPGAISEVKLLLRKCQYDRHASLVLERDYGKYHSPDPYQNCKQGVAVKTVVGLKDSTGSLTKSRSGILEVVRSFYADLLGRKELDRDKMESFLDSTPGLNDEDVPLMNLTEEITVEEVIRAIEQLAIKKSPGPDGLTAEFYKAFKPILAPHLVEVFNSCLAEGVLPSSMRHSAVILLSKGKDPSMIENWRPISLLNVDRKILAKIIFWRLSSVAESLLSRHQHCSVQGRCTFTAVLAVREALERCRAAGWGKYLLTLDQAKAFDRVNHEYLWLLLSKYGLPGGFVDWLKVLYEGAESFPLVNGWVGQSFEVGSGVRQGCPLSPLLYVFAIDPFIRRLESGMLCGVPVGLPGEPPLRVVAYADDVSVIVTGADEAEEVVSLTSRYSEASGSKINQEKSEVFWMGKEGEGFDLPDTFPVPQERIKILGIEFGPGDYGLKNWEGRLEIANTKVVSWKRWKLSMRERVDLIKTYLIPIFLYVSFVCILPVSLYARVSSVFFQMLWGNRLNPIKRNVTYLSRREGGLGMVNPVLFFSLLFLKFNIGNMLAVEPPGWAGIFRSWFRPFLRLWEEGGQVKNLRGHRGQLPAYVAPCLKLLRQWRLSAEDLRSVPRKVLMSRVLSEVFHDPLALRDCPGPVLRAGLRLINLDRVPPKFRDLAWLCFHGRLYVRGNLKFRSGVDRSCPREECAGEEETMDHFLLHCPFNIEVYKQVGRALGVPFLSRLGYAEWVYGAFNTGGVFCLDTLFLVSLVVRYFTWNARCQVSIRHKILPVQVVVYDILHEVEKIRVLERDKRSQGAWLKAWRGFKPP